MEEQLWAERFRAALKASGYSREDVAERTGRVVGTVNEWARGARMPRGDAYEKLMQMLPDLGPTPTERSAVVGEDSRDPNGYAVHLPMDPARRAEVLTELLQAALRDQRAQ